MSIIPSPPNDVRQCRIYKVLHDKSTPSDGTVERVEQLIATVGPLLEATIAGPFKEYTLHNANHAKKLLHLAEHIAGSETVGALSSLECMVIMYSAYLHDAGMSIGSPEDRVKIVASPEYLETVRAWPEVWNALQRARQRLESASDQDRFDIEVEIFQLQEAGLCAYLRPRHATPDRYKQIIEFLKRATKREDLFEFNGVSLEANLIDVCASHNLDAGVLAEVYGTHGERFPRELALGGERLNTQFCAAILRLADIMDIDRERTPRVLFESLGISARSLAGADVTLREWQRHMAVHTLDFGNDEVVVYADSRHPAIEKTIRDFCQVIEREIRDVLAILRANKSEIVTRYNLSMPICVRPSIRSMGYVFRDISLRMNQAAIMALLMGDRLYADEAVPIRELIQNAIDACSARQKMEVSGTYQPKISVSSAVDSSNRRWMEVSDNGIGMDEYVLEEYFLTLGNSYYDSPEFHRLLHGSQDSAAIFTPISRFGIGIVSVFMIADAMEIQTSCSHSSRQDSKCRLVRIERSGGLAFISECGRTDPGTVVRIRMRPEVEKRMEAFLGHVAVYLRETIVRPRFPIDVRLAGSPWVLRAGTAMSFDPTHLDKVREMGIEAVLLDIGRSSKRLSGDVVMLFAKGPEGRLSLHMDGAKLRFVAGRRLSRSGEVAPEILLNGYYGNRITVNGFKMNMKRLAKSAGLGKRVMAIAFDIDVRGDDQVIYDVSRDRIMGSGRRAVIIDFWESILAQLQETGMVDRLDDKSRDVLRSAVRLAKLGGNSRPNAEDGFPPRRVDLDAAFLEAVRKELPDTPWPQGINKAIAVRVGASFSSVSRAISALLETGALKKPT